MVRIAIIGGGSSGITAAKQCINEGFDVVVYEKTHFIGGLWYYHEDDVTGVASVAKSTIINTSKELSAFSDFPPPDEFPNYMHNTKMHKYFELYAESFNFKKYVKFSHEIVSCECASDYEETGKWKLKIRDLSDGKIFEEIFDGVMICTGHHVTPSVPKFPGMEKFKGQITHTHSYKKPEGFDDTNAVVIGIGNSGVDAAVELSHVAKQTYLSTRTGSWIFHRVGLIGRPFDIFLSSRIYNFICSLLTFDMKCSIYEKLASISFDHSAYRLKPKHRIFGAHPTINDALGNRILSGTLTVKGNVERFTENGIIFEGDNGNETLCDAVVMATGYKLTFPFISQDLIPVQRNWIDLYKNMFSPLLSHPKTLAFMGLTQPIGAIFPIAEMQSRVFTQLMTNKIQLPSIGEMKDEIRRKRIALKSRYKESERHTLQVDFIPFMDELAEMIGVKPNLYKYFFTDFPLWKAIVFGPSVSYQYRLKGPHPWSGARNAILKVENRIAKPLTTKPQLKEDNNNDYNYIKLILKLTIVLLLIYYFFF